MQSVGMGGGQCQQFIVDSASRYQVTRLMLRKSLFKQDFRGSGRPGARQAHRGVGSRTVGEATVLVFFATLAETRIVAPDFR